MSVPEGTYVVTCLVDGFAVINDERARTALVRPGESAWVGLTVTDEVDESGCWTPEQACANEIANIIPFLGLGSEVTGVLNGLCEVGHLWTEGRYLWSVFELLSTIVDILDVLVVDVPTYDWVDALAECGLAQFRARTASWSIGKRLEGLWQHGTETDDALLIGVEVEAQSAAAIQEGRISVPLEVHFYSGSDHLGRKPDGTVEHTIPRSFLFGSSEGTDQLAIVKGATADYELVIDGQQATSLTLSLINPQSDGTSTQVIYPSLSVSGGSVISLDLGPDVEDFTLKVDVQGDGVIDDTIDPESTERLEKYEVYLPLVMHE